jgi:tRNA-Thr(GGU) m(6)t(6)A37 methyltransferase TsaA
MAAPDLAQERLVAIGEVRSSLTSLDEAPRQPGEGAPEARIVVEPAYREALSGIAVGDPVVVVTWLHMADRTTLTTHPRNDPTTPLTGVFATRSPDRPNPIGLHHVRVTAVREDGVSVAALEAVAGTPVLDLKCELAPAER